MSELNIIYKKLRPGIARIAFLYPSLYEVMATSLISHLVYFMVNELFPEIYMERFHLNKLYGPEEPLRSLETSSPLRDFNLIITSLHYEPDIANIVRALYFSGIDPRRKRRDQIVVAGGPAVMANPHPYSKIIDAFIIGEAEDTLPEIMELYLEYGDSKQRFLEELSGLEYVYVPDYSDGLIYRRYVADLDKAYYPVKQFQHRVKEPVYGRGVLLESSRGCKFWCRFCMEGRLFKPYRIRSYSKLRELVDKGLEVNGVDRVIFISLIFLMSIDEKRILEYLVDKGLKASVPSLRFEALMNTDVLELLRSLGQQTITVAPETFSREKQLLFGKYSFIDRAVDLIKYIIEKGFHVKMYMISGFKGETIDDIKYNVDALRAIAQYAKKYGVHVSVSINPLIPKPKTVYQWIGMIDLGKAREIINHYRRELGGLVDTRPYYVNWAWIQASIALADASIGELLIEWGINGGGLGVWRRIIRNRGYDTSYVFKGYRYGDKLPWDNIVIGERVEELNRVEYMVFRRLFRT